MLIMTLLSLFNPFGELPEGSRLKQIRPFVLTISLAGFLTAGWWLASPLFINIVVDEPFPAELLTSSQSVESGQFSDLSFIHRGEGQATILQDGGQRVLRFEDFKVTNGPDLQVLLVEHVDGTDKDTMGEYIDLGPLKGNVGNQNYLIPADVDLSNYSGVMIYCEPFHVVFSSAAFAN